MGNPSVDIHYQRMNSQKYAFRSEKSIINIGRGDDSIIDLNLPRDKKVSRLHARLYFDENCWWLRDMGSKHGTYHNTSQISGNVPISDGDVVVVGETILQIFTPNKQVNREAAIPVPISYVVDETMNSGSLSESERLELLYDLYDGADNNLDALLKNIIKIILERFPDASQLGIANYDEGQLLPLAFSSGTRAHYSADLALQIVNRREATIWNLPDLNQNEKINRSLDGVYSAMYVPVIRNQLVRAVIYVHSKKEGFTYQLGDLKLLTGVGQVISEVLAKSNGSSGRNIPGIFVSYSHKDKEYVLQMVNDLRKRAINVYCDDRLQIGNHWQQWIMQAIVSSQMFVLVISEESMESEIVNLEINHALDHHKQIFPVVLRETENIRKEIKQLHHIRIGNDYSQFLDTLSRSIFEYSEHSKNT